MQSAAEGFKWPRENGCLGMREARKETRTTISKKSQKIGRKLEDWELIITKRRRLELEILGKIGNLVENSRICN